MAKLPERYNVGDRDNITLESLLRLLEDVYRDLAVSLNRKPDIIERDTDGQASDTFLSNGDININTSTLKVEMLTEHTTPTTVTWTQLS